MVATCKICFVDLLYHDDSHCRRVLEQTQKAREDTIAATITSTTKETVHTESHCESRESLRDRLSEVKVKKVPRKKSKASPPTTRALSVLSDENVTNSDGGVKP